MLFDRIKFLAEKQGKSINDVERELNYSKNTLYRLKKTNPSAEKLKELADYFHVSSDYLLGRTDSMNIAGNDDPYNHDLKEFIESNMDGMAYGKEDLTEDDKQKLKMALKLVFDKYNDKF